LDKLKREKEEAERYIKLSEELKTARYVLTSKRVEKVRGKVKDIEKKIEELERSKGRYIKELEEIEGKISNLRNKLDNVTEELKEKGNEEILELHKAIRELELTLESDRRNLDNTLNELKNAKLQLKSKREELDNTRKKVEMLKEGILEKEGELRIIEEKIGLLRSERDSLKSKIERWETRINILKGIEGKLTERFNTYQRELHRLRVELSKVLGDIDRKSFQISQNSKEIEKLRKELEALEKEELDTKSIYRELEDVSVELELLKRKVEKLEEEKKKLQRRREELYSEYAKENGKIKALKEMENYNIDNTVRRVLEANLPGVIDIVGNLGKTKEKYKVAVEVAGGSRLKYIVVRSMEDGVRAIEYLKRNKLGRATFLPMDRVKGREPEPILEEGVVGRAIDLVEFQEEYRGIFNYVFGNTYIVKDLKTAKELSKKYRARFVSLEGDVIEPSGAMVGGSVKPSASIKIEIDTEKLERIKEELKDIEERLNGGDGLIVQIERLNERINNYYSKKLELENKLKFIRERERRKIEIVREHNRKIEELQTINRKLQGELEELERLEGELEDEIENLEKKVDDIINKREGILKELKSYEDSTVIKRIRELEEEIEKLERRKDTLENDINKNKTLIEEILIPKIGEIKEKIEELNKKIEILEKNVEFYRNSIEKGTKTLKEKRERYLRLSENLKELTEKKEKYENEIKTLYSSKRVLLERVENIDREINTLSLEKVKWETKLEEEEKKLFEDIEDLHEAVDKLEGMEIEELERHIQEVERAIKKLEPVNMRAIEDYRYIEERYKELLTKRKEYEKDEEKYLQLIQEVERRKKEVFMEVFRKVSKNYEEIYKSIGGKGRLRLENPENPFEGGLLIDASPQNKRLQSLDMMSGGEKSLTALAFLFAIQRLLPAPFYVLDEIDATLDAKNASLIGDMIKNASRDSQFIVISHREQMISKADTLYGVYMENGISKVVGIRLDIEEV
ncbi:MAG TPA: chromosome segregation protein SMC, partial [Methanothermococcus okinawensis]|nr:chromosome segregation protein SMC [Methanothermococcus okinawensis]